MKKYVIYGLYNVNAMEDEYNEMYNFELFIGTGKQLHEVCRDLFDNPNDKVYGDALCCFEDEWLDGNCKEYALIVDFETGKDYPVVHMLAQEHMKIYKKILEEYPTDTTIYMDGFYGDEWDKAKKAIFGEVK